MTPRSDGRPPDASRTAGAVWKGLVQRDARDEPRGLIVILTGAGVSAESGLEIFRGASGLWEGHRAQDVATPEAFARDPELVHRFYNVRRRQLLDAGLRPNAAHLALAQLEAAWPGDVLLITQNVDDLHERAGSRHLLHMHGELLRALCQRCGTSRPWRQELGTDIACPSCHHTGGLRPDVVWFGEMPRHLDAIMEALEHCDLFVAIGTSGQVHPAAGFVEAVNAAGRAHTVELNLETSAVGHRFAERRVGLASLVVPAFVDEILSSAR